MDVGATGPAGIAAAYRLRVAGCAVIAVGRDVPGKGRGAQSPLGSLAGVGAIVAGVTARAGYQRGMVHRVGGEARSRIGVAVAALESTRRNVRRSGVASRSGTVVAVRAIGVGCRMDVGATGKARIAAAHSESMACHAILAIGRDMPRIVGDAVGAFGTLRAVGAIVAGVAAAGADCGVTRLPHGVSGEARCGIDMAVAALDARHGNVWRRGQPGGSGTVVVARATGRG